MKETQEKTNNMITAEEQAQKILDNLNSKVLDDNPEWINRNPTTERLIEFAKLHVEAALKAAAEYDLNCNCDGWESCHNKINKNDILNSYPLNNIK